MTRNERIAAVLGSGVKFYYQIIEDASAVTATIQTSTGQSYTSGSYPTMDEALDDIVNHIETVGLGG